MNTFNEDDKVCEYFIGMDHDPERGGGAWQEAGLGGRRQEAVFMCFWLLSPLAWWDLASSSSWDFGLVTVEKRDRGARSRFFHSNALFDSRRPSSSQRYPQQQQLPKKHPQRESGVVSSITPPPRK